jgi:ubiquinone/menaquinone biosynthesis C-methylase UbiE
MTTASSPNAEAIQVWSEIVGPKYIRHRWLLTRGFAAHGEALWRIYPIAAGERVLDVGCGLGDTTFDLARLVGPTGRVVGFDCAVPFLDLARAEARSAGALNVELQLGDAQIYRFEPTFDRLFSRFGTMFFSSAVAALRNLATALRPGGRLTMAVWRSREVNEWVSVARDIVAAHLPQEIQGPTCGPGPFSMADPEAVSQQLAAAGYVDIAFHPVDAPVNLGTVDEAIAFALDLGPAGELMRLAGEAAEAARPRIIADLEKGFRGFLTPEGVVMGTRSWCVAARQPR